MSYSISQVIDIVKFAKYISVITSKDGIIRLYIIFNSCFPWTLHIKTLLSTISTHSNGMTTFNLSTPYIFHIFFLFIIYKFPVSIMHIGAGQPSSST